MSLFKFKNIAIMAAMGLMLLVVGSSDVGAQTRREVERERQRIERDQRRIARQRQQRDRGYRGSEGRIYNANYDHGYQQGMLAGQYDRRRGKYNQSNVYRGTGAYPNGGDPTTSDYIYRQGYLQGYNDGFNGRINY